MSDVVLMSSRSATARLRAERMVSGQEAITQQVAATLLRMVDRHDEINREIYAAIMSPEFDMSEIDALKRQLRAHDEDTMSVLRYAFI